MLTQLWNYVDVEVVLFVGLLEVRQKSDVLSKAEHKNLHGLVVDQFRKHEVLNLDQVGLLDLLLDLFVGRALLPYEKRRIPFPGLFQHLARNRPVFRCN